LQAQDPDGDPITLRIVSQPAHGTVALDGASARYFPGDGYVGADSFTFAAWDGSTDSNLGTVNIDVAALVGDTSCDGALSAADLVAVMTAIGNGNSGVCSADVNNSGAVDEADLEIVISVLFGM
jgi:hypothetical protein